MFKQLIEPCNLAHNNLSTTSESVQLLVRCSILMQNRTKTRQARLGEIVDRLNKNLKPMIFFQKSEQYLYWNYCYNIKNSLRRLIMKYIKHIFKGDNNELQQWQTLVGGVIDGNTLHAPEGIIREYKFDSHKIIIVRLLLTEDVTTMRIMDKPVCYYPIIFSDGITFEPQDEGRMKATFSHSSATGIYFSSENAEILYPKGTKLNLVLFRLSYQSFERVLSADHLFLKCLTGSDSYFFYESISVEMKTLIQHLLDDPSPDKLDSEFAYARSWELFLLFAHKFFYQRQNQYKQIDNELLLKLGQVKDFILSDLSAPKNIEELTSFGGMSATKLRASFKEVYGMSMYTLFQEHRMERARELLQEGARNVSEVAYMLGYTHLGHFTGAFKQKYHYLPKNLK